MSSEPEATAEHRAPAADGVGTGRGFDRFVNFSDAVVAIAITLLGLPLVDIAAPHPDQTAAQVLSDHAGELLAFVYTFLVVAAMWAAHNRIFTYIRGYDNALVWLNMLFLLAIVAVPFPSEWVGEHGFGEGAGTFYLLTLTLSSGALGLIAIYTRRNQKLLYPWARLDGERPLVARRSMLFAGFFAVCALLALPWPDTTSWLMLLLIPVSILERRLEARQTSSGSSAGAGA